MVVGTDTGSFTLDVQCKSIWFSLVPKLAFSTVKVEEGMIHVSSHIQDGVIRKKTENFSERTAFLILYDSPSPLATYVW